MINPELDDWWTHKRLTNLRYKETALSGAGVSVQVLTKAFNEDEFSWFSMIYGEFHDNFLLVAMDNQTADKFCRSHYDSGDKERLLYGQVLKNEYKITDEIATELGIVMYNDDFTILNRNKFVFYIHSHDNCFFWIEPISSDLLTRIIQVILKQHSFYLGKEIQWDEIESQLVEIIKDKKEVDIQSDSRKQCLWIPQLESSKKFLWKRLKQKTIIIDGLNASFRKES